MLKRISDGVPDPVELYAIWIAIGLSALVGWITLSGSLVAMMKLKGGFYIPFTKKDDRGRSKWVSFPTWGPPWLNYVKVLLLLSSIALIAMTIQEPKIRLDLFFGGDIYLTRNSVRVTYRWC